MCCVYFWNWSLSLQLTGCEDDSKALERPMVYEWFPSHGVEKNEKVLVVDELNLSLSTNRVVVDLYRGAFQGWKGCSSQAEDSALVLFYGWRAPGATYKKTNQGD